MVAHSATMAKTGVNFLIDKTGIDEAQGLVTGWAAIVTDEDGDHIRDSQGDIITIEALENLAAQVMIDGQADLMVGKNHIEKGKGIITESMVISKEKREALNFGKGVGGWLVTLKLTDRQLFEDIVSGEMPELSIFVAGKKNADGNYDYLEPKTGETLSVVDSGASGNEQHRPAIVLAKRSGSTMTLEEILAAMPEDERKIIIEAIAAGKGEPDGDEPADSMAKAEQLTPEEQAKKDEEDKKNLAKRGDLIDVIKRLEQTNASLALKVQSVQDERAVELLAKRAEAEFSNIPCMTFLEMGQALKSIEDNIPKDIAKRLTGSLRAASVALGTTFGNDPIGSNSAGVSDAYGQLQTIAKRKRAEDPSITAGRAMELAIKENQQLYKEAR